MAKNNKGKTVSIRLSELMLKALDARASLESKDRTQVIRNAISRHLDLPKESIEDKLQAVEKKQVLLNETIAKLDVQLKKETERTDSIEIRIDELGKIVAVFMDRGE